MAAKKAAKQDVKKSAKKSVAKATQKKSASSVAKPVNAASAALFPKGVSQPATRALASVGVTTVDQLTKHREADLAALHGMGPKALGILNAELKSQGKSFKA